MYCTLTQQSSGGTTRLPRGLVEISPISDLTLNTVGTFFFFDIWSGADKRRLLLSRESTGSLGPLTTDAASQLDVLWHDSDTLGVDGTQVGVLEQSNEVCFAGLLESHHGGALESEVGFEVLSDLTDQSLEGKFPQQELGRLLVSTDFLEGHCSWPVSVGFLDSSGGRGALTGGLGCQLLSGGLSSSRFTGGLLGTSHFVKSEVFGTVRLVYVVIE